MTIMERIEILMKDCEMQVRVLDLIGDQWRDFEHFYHESSQCEQRKDLVGANRSKRSSLVCMWSHTDGIVQALYGKHKINFDPFINRDNKGRCSLKRLIMGIIIHARTVRSVKLPFVNLESKHLRDIVNHPTKLLASGEMKMANFDRKVTISDIFDLPLEELKKSSDGLDRWLNAACKLYKIERFADYNKIFDELADALKVKYKGSVKM